jgi:hypothetical protein
MFATLDTNGYVAIIGAVVIGILQVLNWIKTNILTKDVHKIEVATNSMKDALVKASRESSFAAGRESGRDESRSKAR